MIHEKFESISSRQGGHLTPTLVLRFYDEAIWTTKARDLVEAPAE